MVRAPSPGVATATEVSTIGIAYTLAIGVAYKPSAQVSFKLEGHRSEGYSFDTPVRSVIAPTAPPLVARLTR